MSPHQHGEVGIGVFEIVAGIWLFTRQNSALLYLLVQIRKFLNDSVTVSFPFTDANGRGWIGMRVVTRTLDYVAHRLKLWIRHIVV